MGKNKLMAVLTALVLGFFAFGKVQAGLRGGPSADDAPLMPAATQDKADVAPVDETPQDEVPAAAADTTAPKKSGKKILSGSDGFIAGPDWEFDGFVAGGQGQEVRSMFVANDLLYLNVGKAQEIKSGDRVGIYKRGARIRDPQSGRFIGYEVRRIATSEITDKLDEETCSARVIKTNDGIEIGDLVRRDVEK